MLPLPKQVMGRNTATDTEALLRRGKVGAVPTSINPVNSPGGPHTTVPVLGCFFLQEFYPSLASQPSFGAKQGDGIKVKQCP